MKKTLTYTCLSILVLFVNSCDLLNSDPTRSDLKTISGNFDNWNLGSDKVLRYGIYDNNGNFTQIGSTPISNNGAFKIDSLLTPPDYSFEAIGNGPFNGGCSGSINVSNKNAQVSAASFIVTEQNLNKVVGRVYHATGEIENDFAKEVGGFYTQYVFSKDTTTLRGENICTNNNVSVKNQVDAKIKIGWNKVVFKTMESSSNTNTVLISTRLSSGGRWYFIDDRPILQPEYDINLSGTIENWSDGSGKQLQLGEFNYQTNQFHSFAYADISSDGKFSLLKTKSPEISFLRTPKFLYADQTNCSITLDISDPKASAATSRMIIVDKATQKMISEIFYGVDNNKNGSRDAGDSEFQFVFSDRPVNISGESTCNFINQNGQASKDYMKVSLALTKGWTKVAFQFTEFTQTSTKRNLTNQNSNSGSFYYKPTQPDISGSFPISLSGKFDFWQEGANKIIVVGETDYQTQILSRFGTGDISSEGQFSINSAVAPGNNFLRPAQNLFVDPNSCSTNLTISDYNARVAVAHFFILDKNSGVKIGVGSFGNDIAKNGRQDPGDYQISLIFSDRNVTISGESSCNYKDPNGNPFLDTRKYNLDLKKGWNVVTEKILEIGSASWKLDLTTGMPSVGNWYYGK